MSSYTQLLYQIVFSTKEREKTLSEDKRLDLFKYIWGLLKEKKCILYQIGGVEDHLHIVTHIHPSVAVSDLVKDIKLASSKHIKDNQLFSQFCGWQDGYGAFTYSIDAKENLIAYAKNQVEHHRKVSYKEEYIALLKEHHVEFDERYLM